MDKKKSVGRPKAEKKVSTKKVVKPKTVKPKTVKPKTVKPKTVKPKTVKPKTVKPKTVKPKTVKPKTVKPKTVKPKAKKTVTKKSKGFLGFVKEMFSMNGGGDGHCPEGMIENLETGELEKFEMNGGGPIPAKYMNYYDKLKKNKKREVLIHQPHFLNYKINEVNEVNEENNNKPYFVGLPPRKKPNQNNRLSLKNKVLSKLENSDYERARIKHVINNGEVKHYYGDKESQKRFEIIYNRNGKITNVVEQNNGIIALPPRIRTPKKNNVPNMNEK